MKENVLNDYQALYRAMIKKDREVLEDLLDENFHLYHMSGMVQDKVEFIDSILDGTLNYYRMEDEKIDIEVLDNIRKIDGYSLVDAAVFGGGKHRWRLHLKILQKRMNNKWSIIQARAYSY